MATMSEITFTADYSVNNVACVRECHAEPGRSGWWNVTVMKQSGRHADRTWGYSTTEKRWSYNQAPPASVIAAAKAAGVPVR